MFLFLNDFNESATLVINSGVFVLLSVCGFISLINKKLEKAIVYVKNATTPIVPNIAVIFFTLLGIFGNNFLNENDFAGILWKLVGPPDLKSFFRPNLDENIGLLPY